jgi:uncharacterized protein (TIGR02145 family)
VTFSPAALAVCSGDTTLIILSSAVPGTMFSWSAVLTGGTVTGFSAGSGDTIGQPLINPLSIPGEVTYTVTPKIGGCNGMSMPYPVTVNPLPVIMNGTLTSSQCHGATTDIVLQSAVPGSSFTWTATASSPLVSGFSDGSGGTIQQTLMNPDFLAHQVFYRVVPATAACTGPAAAFVITVNPQPDVWFVPAVQEICSGQTTSIILQGHVAGTVFSWVATSGSAYITGYASGSGNLIGQQLVNSHFYPGQVSYAVTPETAGCTGIPATTTVDVNPVPEVNLTACFDTLTTTSAKPFRLRGATPPGGLYSGPGVNTTTGLFTPSVAGTGVKTITYTYTNLWQCSTAKQLRIRVSNPAPVVCGQQFTDIRDGRRYPTVQIGSQCWLAANLDYGTGIPLDRAQRDNCLPEKFCYHDLGGNCALYGGLYQWDELMTFEEIEGIQGLCPPGWHIPTEADWSAVFNHYLNIAFAGSPLLYSGYSGFNALLSGAGFKNREYDFEDFATLLWTSKGYTAYKAWAHGMNDYNHGVSWYPAARSNAFGVRCIRD